MHQEYTTLHETQTVGEALERLRKNPPGGRIIYFYVVDAENRLRGVVPVRRLVLSPLDSPINRITVHEVVKLPETATVLDACEFFILHRLLALPIVDAQDRLLGMIDIELYTEEIGRLSDALRNDIFQLIGVRALQAQHASALSAFRLRFPWLSCNIAAGLICAFLAGVFEPVLQQVVELAFFIPVVLNLAESVSSQSVTLAIQMLHGQAPSWRGMAGRMRQELGTGLMLGLGSGAVIALVALAWLGRWRVALSLVAGIAGGVTGAAVIGLALPIALRLLRLEPRVAAGPIALAAADVLTILLYLNVARWLLG